MNDQMIDKLCQEILALPRSQGNLLIIKSGDESFKKYENVISKLEKEWGDKYSRNYIDKIVKTLVHRFPLDEIEALKSELKAEDIKFNQYDTEQTVYIPVDGIDLRPPQSLEIGNVSFSVILEDEIRNILHNMEDVIHTMPYSDSEKQNHVDEREKYLKDKFQNRVCATMRKIAEPEKAYEITILETIKALEVLRYSIPCFNYAFDTRKRVEIGLHGDIPLAPRTVLARSSSGFTDKWDLRQQPLNLWNNFTEKLDKIGFYELSEILKKDKKTEFERIILRFLYWISDSYVQIESENRLLSLIISLETLFGSGPHATGFGAAMLLGENLEQRRKIKSRVAKLYQHRNQVAHGGRKSNVEDEDIAYLIMLTMELMIKILEFVKNGVVKNKKDLEEIIETKQLS
ncbi:MAG: hypothetical protein F6K30_13020 [Cyanothece sp. SIO2G6]|nr:hypothetical protein [Cyanothece sp. SIO2G6]